MPSPVILILLVFWCYFAYQALQRGDVTRAVLYLLVGLALTWWRLDSARRRRAAATRRAPSVTPTDLGR
jgi:hypothetical protein